MAAGIENGGGEIRTLAALARTNGLANRPLGPLGYSSELWLERREEDLNPRYP